MDFAAASLAFTALTFLLAGLVKGVVGMGLPTIAIGLLAEAMPPSRAAALLLIPSFVTNIWQLLAGPNCLALIRRLWPLLAGIGLGTVAGSGWLAQDQGDRASMGLGAALIVYALFGLARVKLALTPSWEGRLGAPIGVATGIVTAATGIFVIPAVPYIGALRLGKDDLVQALGLSFTVSTLALAGSLLSGGELDAPLAGLSLLALVPALVGMQAGQLLRRRVPPDTFRTCFFVGLLGLGADQLIRPLLS